MVRKLGFGGGVEQKGVKLGPGGLERRVRDK